METLRERAYRVLQKPGSMLYGCADMVGASPAVDVSEAVSYFLEQTPEEDTFSLSDLPLAAGLQWLSSNTKLAFVETEAPPEYGLPWATLLGWDADQQALERSIREAGQARGVDTEIETGDPGVALMDSGLVARAGVFVYLDEPLGGEGRASYYQHLFSERLEIDELAGVLQLVCFAEIEGGGSEGVRSLIEPSLIWYLPLDGDGRIHELGGGSDELMLVAPGVGDLESLDDVMDDVADAQKPLLLAVLFSLACAGAARKANASSPVMERAGEDAVGPVEALRMGGIGGALDQRGSALHLGLSHALTVCRAEFE